MRTNFPNHLTDLFKCKVRTIESIDKKKLHYSKIVIFKGDKEKLFGLEYLHLYKHENRISQIIIEM